MDATFADGANIVRRERATCLSENDPTQPSGSPTGASKKAIWVWAPALASEPREMLLTWARETVTTVSGASKSFLVLNGNGAENARELLRRDMPRGVEIVCLTGRASIGRAQQLITHQFLRANPVALARIDPDGQFPINCLAELERCLQPGGPDLVMAQRDEASINGPVRWLGNTILRCLAMRLGIIADLNAGCYIMNREAAAVLCQVPLPKYPEPRMLMAMKKAGLVVSSCVVPVRPRLGGESSIKGLLRGVRVFLSSLLEMLS